MSGDWGAAPADWMPDPTGRNQLRYWDGTRWTEHVANAGSSAVDPLVEGVVLPTPGAPVPPPPGAGFPAPTAYGQYAYGTSAAGVNGMAIASLVLGILWLYWIGSVLALVFGYVARNQIAESGNTQQGSGMAMAGIVLGWVGVGILAVALIAGAAISSS